MLIDSHTHIYTEEFSTDLDDVVKRASDNGVAFMILPNIDLASTEQMLACQQKYPEKIRLAWGLHPTSVNSGWEEELKKILDFHKTYPGVAIGEIGLDYYWEEQYKEEQKEAFSAQLAIAKETSLPVIIHQRSAHSDTMECVKKVGVENLSGVFHSFSGSLDELDEILTQTNFMIGINGIVTFKNSNLKEILHLIPEDRLLLETDAPYLSPVPKRGKRNEPAYINYIAAFIADVLKETPEKIGEQTAKNARKLFKI